MGEVVRSKIYKLLDTIKDEAILMQVMEDITFYASQNDMVDDLTPKQLMELETAINEADSTQIIPLEDFKKDMDEWRKNSRNTYYKTFLPT